MKYPFNLILKNWWRYGLEVSIGLIIINFSLSLFLVYALVSLFIKIDIGIDYLRKLIRIFSISSEDKLITIQNELGIKNNDRLFSSLRVSMQYSKEEIKSITDDYNDLISISPKT